MPVKFRGKLTNGSIKKLNVYYGGAIHNSSGSVDNMLKAIDASFCIRCLLTPIPKHNPPEEKSWCKFKIAESKGEPVPKHSKSLIPPELARCQAMQSTSA